VCPEEKLRAKISERKNIAELVIKNKLNIS
jgi:hypothetical protein